MTNQPQETLSETQRVERTETVKILVIEKNPRQRYRLHNALAETNYAIFQAKTSWGAYEKLIDYRFDLIISNADLPGMSGLELVRYCQRRLPGTEVIILAKTPKVTEAVSLIKEGAFDYLEINTAADLIREKAAAALLEKKNKLIRSLLGSNETGIKQINPLPDCDIIGPLGTGATGAVFLVKRHGAKYALKILRPEVIFQESNGNSTADFLQEAKILSALQHPNIVRIYEFGVSENRIPYILMEYISGQILTTHIKNDTLEFKEKLAVFYQLCQSLGFIHQAGILHRDIKPGNVILGDNHQVKLMDFGIARIIDVEGENIQGVAMGSPAYMSPEAFDKNSIIDQRSDIFSLGIIAYELFTGRKPFHGKHIRELINAIKTERPSDPTKHINELTEPLSHILANMLHKQPELRFQKIKDIIGALDPIIRQDNTMRPKKKTLLSMLIGGGRIADEVWS